MGISALDLPDELNVWLLKDSVYKSLGMLDL